MQNFRMCLLNMLELQGALLS